MGDNPRENLQWINRELLSAENPDRYRDDTAELLEEEQQISAFAQKSRKKTKGQQVEQAHIARQFDESAAVLTKTGKQMRREVKQRKKAEKKSKVNRNIKGLVFLAILECIGILAIIGWWLQ